MPLARCDGHGRASAQYEEGCVTTLRMTSLSFVVRVLRHRPVQLQPDRYQPGLVEFRVSDRDHSGIQIHVLQSESHGFADP